MNYTAIKNQLEDLVDQIGLSTAIVQLSEICHDKADHLQSNWQDSISAKTWARDAVTLERLVNKLSN